MERQDATGDGILGHSPNQINALEIASPRMCYEFYCSIWGCVYPLIKKNSNSSGKEISFTDWTLRGILRV